MTSDAEIKPAAAAPLDRADARVRHDTGISGAVRGFLDRVRSGDLGSLPVVVGLAIIVTIFRTRRSASVDDVNLLKS